MVGFFLVTVVAGIVMAFAGIANYKERKLQTVFPDAFSPTGSGSMPSSNDKGLDLVVLLGDSRVSQWNPLPVGKGTLIRNMGKSGETTQQIDLRFERDVLAHKPEYVVFQAGINDLVAASLFPERSEEILENLKETIDDFAIRLASSGSHFIILTVVRPAKPSLFRRFVWTNKIQEYLGEVNAHIRSLARFDHVTVLDADRLLSNGTDPLPSRFAKDTLHFKSLVYEILNEKLQKMLQGDQEDKDVEVSDP